MSGRAWGSAFLASSFFWIALFMLHYAAENSWLASVLLALSGFVGGVLIALGVSEALARRSHHRG